jgi:hypothetical protein
MTSEGLGEVFKGDSADTCTGKFPLVSMGGQGNGKACADGERGPPSVYMSSRTWAFLKLKTKKKNLISFFVKFLFNKFCLGMKFLLFNF